MLDFGDAPVFDAIAYASILIGAKEPVSEDHQLKAWTWQRGDKVGTIAQVMGEKAFQVEQKNLTPDGWRIEIQEVFALLAKLKSKGTPLGEYVNGRFYYGIKTGFNEAFVVDRATRDRLIAEHPSSDAVLKPYLRGRDVKRWKAKPKDLWLIFTRRGIDIDAFPAIKKHLEAFKERLMPKPKNWLSGTTWNGRKAGSYEWYEIQDNIAYWEEFEQPKVIIPAIASKNAYTTDLEGHFGNDKTSICIPDNCGFVTCVLNSSLLWWLITRHAAARQNDFFEFKPMYVSVLPIPEANTDQQDQLNNLATQAAQSEGSDLATIEAAINQIVYKLFDLTAEEIRLIESSIKSTAQPKIEGEHGKTPKKNDFFRRLRELADAQSYLSFDRIKQMAYEVKCVENESTLKDYLGEAVAKGILHDAGKGWYTRLSEPPQLDRLRVAPLIEAVEASFPLLDFSVWSTTQLNPWMHHLLAQPVHFLNAPIDTLETIGESLRDNGWEVAFNPPPSAVRKAIRPGEKMVVLRPTLSRQPAPEKRQAPIEQILVDLLAENPHCGLMDSIEAKETAARIIHSTQVQVAGMQRYADSRKLNGFGLTINQPTSPKGR